MTSKRNSRVFVDEGTHSREEVKQRAASYPYRSRRNSRSSSREKTAPVDECTQESGSSSVKEKVVALRSPPGTTVAQEVGVSATGDVTVTMPNMAASGAHLSAPLDGRPLNFGVVMPGVYRSSYPKPEDFGYIRELRLKTIVTLVKRDEGDPALEAFVTEEGIYHVIIDMKGTKKEAIPLQTMQAILDAVLNKVNWPLMIHCNHGKHRTGCVVAVIRKTAGWDVRQALDEYISYANPKVRETDVDYINGFQTSSLQPAYAIAQGPRFKQTQLRAFYRTVVFSTFVMCIWLVSGTRLYQSTL